MQRDRLVTANVDPDDFRRAVGVKGVADTHLVVRFDARAAELPERHRHLDGSRIGQRLPERARRIDDHDAFVSRTRHIAEHLLVPRDPRLLHVAKIHGVVHMVHCIHVAPADWNPLDEDELAWVGHGGRSR